MNVKQTAKKITAVVTGAALFTGLTVSGAAALDLSDYPEPFIMGGVFNGKLVVGEIASSQDIVGAIDIAASLQAQAREGVATGPGGVVDLEGGYVFDEENLNAAFPAEPILLDSRDLAGFSDRTIRWDGKNIRTEEMLWINTEALKAETSIENQNYEEFGTNAYLTVQDPAQIKYMYVFNDPVPISTIDDAPGKRLNVNFLGQSMIITNVEGTGTAVRMDLQTSRKEILREGQDTVVDGRTVTVERIGSTSAIIVVDGDRRVVPQSDVATIFEGADDFELKVDSIFYIEGDANNQVELTLGEVLTRDVRTDDAMEEFGQDENDPEWVWEIQVDNGNLTHIAAVQEQIRIFTPEEVVGEEVPALAYGGSLDLPNNHARITFDGYFDTTHNEVTLSFERQKRLQDKEDITGTALPREDYLVLSSDSTRAPFRVTAANHDTGASSIRADNIFINRIVNNTADMMFEIGYTDGDDDIGHFNVTEIDLELSRNQDDVSIAPLRAGDRMYLTFNFDGEVLAFYLGESTDGTFDIVRGTDDGFFFGDEDGNSVGTDLKRILSGSTDRNLGTVEDGVKLTYGVSFENPESMMDRNNFRMHVPVEKAEVLVTVSGPQTQRTVTAGPTSAYRVNPLGTGIAILDSDARVGTEPYIVVGGPRANTVAATLLGNPSNEEINEMFRPGTAMIRLFANQNALLVAGWEAQDTVRASYVLANFQDYDLSGDAVEIETADVNNLRVRPLQ